jgi:hypothetical protein
MAGEDDTFQVLLNLFLFSQARQPIKTKNADTPHDWLGPTTGFGSRPLINYGWKRQKKHIVFRAPGCLELGCKKFLVIIRINVESTIIF